MYQFRFTQHLRERFCERVHLVRKNKIANFLSQHENVRKMDGVMKSMLKESIECKSLYEQEKLMKFINGKYGDGLKFLKTKKTIFVCKTDLENNCTVLTCYTDKGLIGWYVKEQTY